MEIEPEILETDMKVKTPYRRNLRSSDENQKAKKYGEPEVFEIIEKKEITMITIMYNEKEHILRVEIYDEDEDEDEDKPSDRKVESSKDSYSEMTEEKKNEVIALVNKVKLDGTVSIRKEIEKKLRKRIKS